MSPLFAWAVAPRQMALAVALVLALPLTLPLAAKAVTAQPAGQIWDVQNKRFVNENELYSRLAAADYVLLGERHDNPLHHQLQGKIIREVTARRSSGEARPGVAFEMLRADQQPAIDTFLKAHPRDLDGFAKAVSWNTGGWPAWPLYAPVFSAAVEARAPIFAADISKDWLALAREKGLQALDSAWLGTTGLDFPASATMYAALRQDIIEGHCGMAPGSHLDAMIAIQRLRDAHLASTLARLEAGFLIAGAGHVRKDVAVPFYLQRLAPRKQVVSLAFVEAEPKPELPADAARYDYLWFTPPAPREDPCVKLRERFKALPDRGASSQAPRDRSHTPATTPTQPLPSRSTP